ncbi:long-chain fatty acid transport protein 6 [Periophthalmus magnuspinnatus]|uniref:long-chain fatty acid transport protein 6 n=1 Tax=Periophthalmus magnuspinnatus TaxID=409849 RepID=UPI00145B3098|nr:long-chain fatty acid transport protein 6 [Periophthalmus magnuspinnatus]
MLTLIFTSLIAGVLALLLYQRIAYPFFWDDLIYYLKLRGYKKKAAARMKQGVITYLDCFLYQARRIPNKPFIIFEEQTWTYQDVDRRSNQFANAFRTEGSLKPGDIVALLMCNDPDFICVWLGLCKVGCEVAFLNVNIKAKSLLHCLQNCGSTTLIVGSDLVNVVEEVCADLKKHNLRVWVMDHSSACQEFGTLLDKVQHMPAEKINDLPLADIMSNFLFIFTSGTTGLPKAARVGHLKAVMSMAFLEMCGASSNDVIYITLPLYHMSASLLAVGGCISLGATCVLRKKFSASQFWKDCVKYNVTVVQYIGELCRYLLNQPMVPEERAHCVRLFAGSGLRSDVWKELRQRFGKIKIREGYGLTEASIGFLNYTDEVGPIGRASYFNKLSMPFELLRYDPQQYEPVRTDTGRCIKAETGEPGILVAPLTIMNQFLGYAGNKVQSEKKVLRDLFQPSDVYFNTGDLLLQDHQGFLYFRDRIGDTFRWKGENVSTTEVSEVLGSLDFIQEANVYGVTVPGNEGRAGMAAVVLKPESKLDGPKLFCHLVDTLPAYAWPWFLRVQVALDVTETFKQQKSKLVQEGFNPTVISDPLFFLDISLKTYIVLTPDIFQEVVSGKRSL